MKNNISIKTLSLIAVGVVVIFALFAINPQKSTAPSPPDQPASSQPTPVGQTILSLSPNPMIVNVQGTSQILNVTIQATSEKITAVQLELTYDPNILTNVDIVPGTFLTNPNVLLKEIDKKNGRITYAIGIPPTGQPAMGSGIVANITFTPVGKNQSTQITFLQKTLVTAEGVDSSTLKSSSGTTIILP